MRKLDRDFNFKLLPTEYQTKLMHEREEKIKTRMCLPVLIR